MGFHTAIPSAQQSIVKPPCCPAPIPHHIPAGVRHRLIFATYFGALRRIWTFFRLFLPYFALHYFGLDKTGPNICNGDDVKMVTSNLSAHINDVLRYVGITRNMNAYIILSQALTLIAEDEDRLRAVEKEVYTPIADKRCTSPKQSRARSAGHPRSHGISAPIAFRSWLAIL